MNQPGKVANPARGQLILKINIFLSPLAPEELVSRDGFGVLSRVSLLILHTQKAEPGATTDGKKVFCFRGCRRTIT